MPKPTIHGGPPRRNMSIVKVLPLALLLSCAPTTRMDSLDQKIARYQEVLTLTLQADTLQSYFYRTADGTPAPVIIADDVFSARSAKPLIEMFGQPVQFMSKESADSASLSAYFWVTDYEQHGDEARIMLKDPVRDIDVGMSYDRIGSDWVLSSVYIESAGLKTGEQHGKDI